MTISPISGTTSDDNGSDTGLEVRGVLHEACLGLKQALSEVPPSASGFNLSEQKRILRQKINHRHDPLHRIPFEIASQIFVSYLDESNVEDKIFSPESAVVSTFDIHTMHA